MSSSNPSVPFHRLNHGTSWPHDIITILWWLCPAGDNCSNACPMGAQQRIVYDNFYILACHKRKPLGPRAVLAYSVDFRQQSSLIGRVNPLPFAARLTLGISGSNGACLARWSLQLNSTNECKRCSPGGRQSECWEQQVAKEWHSATVCRWSAVPAGLKSKKQKSIGTQVQTPRSSSRVEPVCSTPSTQSMQVLKDDDSKANMA